MSAQHNARQPPRTERNQDTAAWRHTMTQSLRQSVRKGLIERNGETYIAVLIIAFWH